MRLAVTHNSEIRNSGTATYALAALKEMERDGILEKVQHFQPRGQIPGKWDAYLYVDDGRDDLSWIPPSPWAYWAVDTHLGYGYRLWKAGLADLVFTAQKDGAAEFMRDGIKKATWLPLAAHPAAHPSRRELLEKGADVDKEWDFVFVGYLQDNEEGQNNRVDYLDALYKAFPNSWLSTNIFFEEMAARFSKGRMGFNISIKRDLNMRVFEVMSTATPLLTNRDVEGIDEFFEDGDHYFGYEGKAEMLEVAGEIFRFLDDDDLADIGERALKEVRSKHTYRHRMEVIVEELKHA